MQTNHTCKENEHLLNPPIQLPLPKEFHIKTRQLLSQAMHQQHKLPANSIALFKSEITKPIQDQDIEETPQQEANFHYLFGAQETDCYGIVDFDTSQAIMFCPNIPEAYEIWMVVNRQSYFKQTYAINDCFYVEELNKYLEEKKPSEIHLYDGENSDSGLRPSLPTFDFLEKYKIVKHQLYHTLNELRTIKHPEEIEQLMFINKISSDAHVRVMQNTYPHLKEYQMESLFKFHVQERCGSKAKAYDCICASGQGNATLHYNANTKLIADNCLILNDMGSKYNGYCSDITVTFPSNGKFTQKQKHIYQAVYEAYKNVLDNVKEGVQWDDMHLLAEKTILKHLINIGIVVNAPMEELIEKRIGAVFFPHGLGHFIGLCVHDVGGYNPGHPERHSQAGLKNLRTRRTLQAGNCITVEPGCYFKELIIEKALNNQEQCKYLVKEKIEEYKEVGGVRLEDGICITKTGYINFTNVPRTIEEVEKACAGLHWKN
ncbi:metallopeptidase family m24, putative [Ichthyophthirius multifiliis]|uniref:Xaa-Pro dipeptidase n=1 Tax=Ichthyophthirius multifiliis TaxID=5932 RepID=G0R4H4_ICHMU|nr:metallopeptidase family m24, putative [Ichthyophthirius multifiliis]EGR27625.1 metallopeptidase family m24, putative [Ichthyophthirius multifiliis]|eukprot:XP_004025077.1 metallopeptidase family m24, putative [Ichthyophthirius multifiliis]